MPPNNEAEREKLKSVTIDLCQIRYQSERALEKLREPIPPTENGEPSKGTLITDNLRSENPDPLFSPNHAIYIGNLKKRIGELETTNTLNKGLLEDQQTITNALQQQLSTLRQSHEKVTEELEIVTKAHSEGIDQLHELGERYRNLKKSQVELVEALKPTLLILEEMAQYDSGEQKCLASEAAAEVIRLKTLTTAIDHDAAMQPTMDHQGNT